MKYAKQTNFFLALLAIALCAIIVTVFFASPFTVYAETDNSAVYCDDGDLYDTYDAQGSESIADYDVYYDSYEISELVAHTNAPSFKNYDQSALPNACGALAGANVVGFFDRWSTNLIPNYEPGMVSAGKYIYYPDMMTTETMGTFKSIYDLMKVKEVGGTTSSNFKSGLNTYVKNAGYNLSYSSMYKNTTSVDLSKLTAAINQNKVGIVMCKEYNYVLDIANVASESRVRVVKKNSTIAHMMMVYGYQTYKYYKDGVNFRTDTFLYVCSSYASGDRGYMLLDDFLKINEALIMTIS